MITCKYGLGLKCAALRYCITCVIVDVFFGYSRNWKFVLFTAVQYGTIDLLHFIRRRPAILAHGTWW